MPKSALQNLENGELGSTGSSSAKKVLRRCLDRSRDWTRRKASECCSIEGVHRVLPVTSWLPKYHYTDITSDAVAGITVGLTAIPQSMGYAQVAGLRPEYGLYSSFMGCFMYFFFGSTRPANIGPTAIMALLTREHAQGGGPAGAILLCFLSGCITLGLGVLNLGFLIDFISSPVISGFSSAAAIIICSTQMKGLLGIKIEDENVISVLTALVNQIQTIKYWDMSLGLGCIVLLLILRRLGSIQWSAETPSKLWFVIRKFVWFMCAARNVVVVVVVSGTVYALECHKINPFSLTGNVPSGLPSFEPPPFLLTKNNETVSFMNSLKDYGTSLLLVPLLAILEHIAISKVFCLGKSLDATQELIALGVANIMGSFVSSFPTTGSFSRTALNADCGVKSPMGGIFTGVVVLLALGWLTPSFHFIPKATLSAVIITAVIFMVEYRILPHMWKTKKTDLAVMLITFFSCLLLGVEYGILIGISFSMIILLYNTARPRITINPMTVGGRKYIYLQPDRMLNFPSVEYLRHRINKATKGNGKLPIILDGIYLCGIDYTVIQCVKSLTDEFQEKEQGLIFINLKSKVVEKIKVLQPSTFHYYASLEAMEASLHNQNCSNSLELGEVQTISNVDLVTLPSENRNVSTIPDVNRNEKNGHVCSTSDSSVPHIDSGLPLGCNDDNHVPDSTKEKETLKNHST